MQGPLTGRGLSSSSPSIKDLEVNARVLMTRPADHTKAGEQLHSRDPVPHTVIQSHLGHLTNWA